MSGQANWATCDSVGIPEMDADHDAMLAIAFALRDELLSGTPNAQAMSTLDDLLELALAHFEREEMTLERAAYPLLDAHRQAHDRLLRAMLHFREDVRHQRYKPTLAVNFIHAWVVQHVRVEDSRYAEFLRGTAGGPSSALQASSPAAPD